MSPRTLPRSFKATQKQRRRAQEQADRDGAPMAVVAYDDLVFVRPLVRALALRAKHPTAQIVHECFPGAAS